MASVVIVLKPYYFDKSWEAKIMTSWELRFQAILLSISIFNFTVALLRTFTLLLFQVLFFSYQ